MKIKYRLQGSKRIIVIGNSQVFLNSGENETQITNQLFTNEIVVKKVYKEPLAHFEYICYLKI